MNSGRKQRNPSNSSERNAFSFSLTIVGVDFSLKIVGVEKNI
jgi:hypothetical protein